MLTHLYLRDLAIVDLVEIEFRSGLTVLTGETGAGKSIIVDALQIAAGGRASGDVVRAGAERAEVAATFELRAPSADLRALLDEQAIETAAELVLRRVITAEGKSRAFVNGQSVTVQTLRAIGAELLDIHGQHEFQALARAAHQRALLDRHAGLESRIAELAALHTEAGRLRERLATLEAAARDRDARLDMLRYQLGELDAQDLDPAAIAALADERSRLANRGRLDQAARFALQALYESDEPTAHTLAARAASQLRQVAGLDSRLAETLPGVDEAVSRMEEAGRALAAYVEGLEADPARQEQVEATLAALESLARKHRVAIGELAPQAARLRAEREALERLETDAASLQQAHDELVRRWQAAATEVSAARRRAAAELGDAIGSRMRGLGMPGGRFEIALTLADLPPGRTSAHGIDDVEFLVSANPGQPPRPIGRVASGGELSRLSLAVQVACSRPDDPQSNPVCMVFDEVDAGVGGAVAEIVGRELAAIGRRGQSLCVTHLPQVASQGEHHLRVSKISDGRHTRTQVVALAAEERVEELARMLGGVSVTESAREHAREMLRSAARKPAVARLSASRSATGGGRKGGR